VLNQKQIKATHTKPGRPINKLRVFLFPEALLSALCGESASIKLKKAILSFFIANGWIT
jgi:hypothetical protein